MSRLGPVGKALVSAVVVVALGVGVYAVYAAGAPDVPAMSGSPAPETAAEASPAIDQAQVMTLMQRISESSGDIEALQELADLYLVGGDPTSGITFAKKILALDPQNVQAHVALGAGYYNVFDTTAAEQEWRTAIALDPKNPDPHFYLGYLYLSATPPEMAKVRSEWETVVELAPGTDVAKQAQTHLDALAAQASASPAASASSGD